MEHMYLAGAEQVENAGRAMRSASEDMLRAANIVSETHIMFIRDLREQIDRLEALKEKDGESKDSK